MNLQEVFPDFDYTHQKGDSGPDDVAKQLANGVLLTINKDGDKDVYNVGITLPTEHPDEAGTFTDFHESASAAGVMVETILPPFVRQLETYAAALVLPPETWWRDEDGMDATGCDITGKKMV